MSETKVPSIPAVSENNLGQFARAIKQILDVREGRAGDPLDANVTYRDLINAGAVVLRPGFKGGASRPIMPPWSDPDGYDPTTDFTIPPRPEGFTATGLFAVVQLQWDRPTYRNHSYTEIWRSETNVLGDAILVGTTDTSFYTDSIGTGGTRFYWARFVSQADVKGPYHSTDGIQATTATDPALVIASLQGQITESELFAGLAERISLIDAPASVINSVNNRIAVVQGQVNDLLNIPAWDSSISYQTGEQATFQGGLYAALQPSTGVQPTNTAFWQKIGDYTSLGDAVATQGIQISQLENGLGQAVTQTNALAVQLRGNYTGNNISLLSSGLLFQERQARASADSALASDITTLSAFVNTKSRVFYQSTQPVGTTGSPLSVGDLWIDTNITFATDYLEGDYVIRSNRMYRWNGTAWEDAMDFGFADWFSAINIERTSRIAGDEALSTQVTSVIALANSNTAAINQEITARANADNSITAAINSLTATVNSNQSSLTAAIQSESTARANADSSLTTQINTLSSTVSSNNTSLTAAIQTEATTRANADNTLFAQYTVKVDVNGYVSGYGLASSTVTSTPQSSFVVRSDSFLIGNPTGAGIAPAAPFIVRTTATTINGVSVPIGVYITDGFIQNGTITNAKIANLAVDNAKIANLDAAKITTGFLNADRIQVGTLDAKLANINAAVITSGTINAARIGDATITTAKIADTIQSTNFTSGPTGAGWRIQKNGNMEINTATFRGTIDVRSGASGARLEIKNNVIKVFDASGTLRVKIGDLAA